jgi:hypothetical protein
MTFEKSVFINCPFDKDFYALLRPILFTVIYLGFQPRIALESLDSGQPRIQKIIKLIENSKFAIHDLSRIKSKKVGELFRLNMPFELGLDVGCRIYKRGKWQNKKCLILEAEKYRYQAAISDLSNSDIGVHNNEPEEVVLQIRNWLNNEADLDADGPSKIWGAFNDFMAEDYDNLTSKGFSKKDIERLPVNELMNHMNQWVKNNT